MSFCCRHKNFFSSIYAQWDLKCEIGTYFLLFLYFYNYVSSINQSYLQKLVPINILLIFHVLGKFWSHHQLIIILYRKFITLHKHKLFFKMYCKFVVTKSIINWESIKKGSVKSNFCVQLASRTIKSKPNTYQTRLRVSIQFLFVKSFKRAFKPITNIHLFSNIRASNIYLTLVSK